MTGPQRRSRRARNQAPEIAFSKSDEESPSEAGGAKSVPSDADTYGDTNATETSSRPRRRQRGGGRKGSEASNSKDNMSDDGESQENTDIAASSDDEQSSTANTNQALKRARRQKKPTETNDSGEKTPKRRGRTRKIADLLSNDEATSDVENENHTMRKSKRKNAGGRKPLDYSSSEDEASIEAKKGRGRTRKIQIAGDGGGSNEDKSTKGVKKGRGRPRKNQTDDDSETSKMETANANCDDPSSGNEDDSTKQVPKRRVRPTKYERRDGIEAPKMETANNAEDDEGSSDEDKNLKDSNEHMAKSNRPNEVTSNDEVLPRTSRRQGKPKGISEPSFHYDGEQNEQSKGANETTSVQQTPKASSNEGKSSDETASINRRGPERPRNIVASSTNDEEDAEASETTSGKHWKPRKLPPFSSSNHETFDRNKQTWGSQKTQLPKMETTDELMPAGIDKAMSSEKTKAQGSPEVSIEKANSRETTSANADSSYNLAGDRPYSTLEPPKENEDSANDSTVESVGPMPSRRSKRQRSVPLKSAEDSAPNSFVEVEVAQKDVRLEGQDKKRARIDEEVSMKDTSDPTSTSASEQAKQGCKGTGPESSPTNEKMDENMEEEKESIAALSGEKVLEHATTKLDSVEKVSHQEDASGDIYIDSKMPTVKDEKRIEIVAEHTMINRKDISGREEGKETESPSVAKPLWTKPSTSPIPASNEIVAESQKDSQQDAAVFSQSAADDVPIPALEVAKESIVAKAPPSMNDMNTHGKVQEPSSVSDSGKGKEQRQNHVDASSKQPEKASNRNTGESKTASGIYFDDPAEDVVMEDAEKIQVESPTSPYKRKPTIGCTAQRSTGSKFNSLKNIELTSGIKSPSVAQMDCMTKTSSFDADTANEMSSNAAAEKIAVLSDARVACKDSNAGNTAERDQPVSDNNLECARSSMVTESSEDEEESEVKEGHCELRFETRVLPFRSSFMPKHPTKQQASLSVHGKQLSRLKAMIYSLGSKLHCGRGFERLFSEYWGALTMRLSDRLSSHANSQCSATIKAFLKSSKLRRMHNKLIVTLMKASMKSFAPLNELSEYIPGRWCEKVKRVDRVPVDEVKKAKRMYMDQTSRNSRKHSSIYSEAWASRKVTEDNPISSERLKTESQEVDIKKVHASSASIPGALVIDPLVRDLAQQNKMRASENAIWLLVVAAREHTSNIIKNALKQKKRLESGDVPDPFLQYPKVIAGTKNSSKKDSSLENQERLTLVDCIPGKPQKYKLVTSFDIYASSLAVPATPSASFGGSVSLTAMERCQQNAFALSPCFPGADFTDVHKHVVEEVTVLAQKQKNILLASSEEIKSKVLIDYAVNKASNIVSKNHKMVNTNLVPGAYSRTSGNPVINTLAVNMNAPSQAEFRPHQSGVTASEPVLAVQMQQQKMDPTVKSIQLNTASTLLNTPDDAMGGLGRGAKDLAALMKRSSSKPAGATSPGPVAGARSTAQVEGSKLATNPTPPKPNTNNDTIDELSLSGSGRRGKGFGTKNLAAMMARSTKAASEKSTSTLKMLTVAEAGAQQKQEQQKHESQKQDQQKQEQIRVPKPTGGKDLAVMKSVGAKNLAAIKVRSIPEAAMSKPSEEINQKVEDKVKSNEASAQATTEIKPDPKEIESGAKGDAPVKASLPPETLSQSGNKKAATLIFNDGVNDDKDMSNEKGGSVVKHIELVQTAESTEKESVESAKNELPHSKSIVGNASAGQQNGQTVEMKPAIGANDNKSKHGLTWSKSEDASAKAKLPSKDIATSFSGKEPQGSTAEGVTDGTALATEEKEPQYCSTIATKPRADVKQDVSEQIGSGQATANASDNVNPKESEIASIAIQAHNSTGEGSMGAESIGTSGVKPEEKKADESKEAENKDERAESSK